MDEGLAGRLTSLGVSELQNLMDAMPFGIALAGADGSNVVANAEFGHIFELELPLPSGISLRSVFGAGGIDWFQIENEAKTTARVQFRMPSRASKSLDVMVIRSVETSQRGSRLTVIVTDVSLNDRIERALSESESRARGFFEQDLVGMARIAENTKFLEVNHTLCRLVGRSRDELLNAAQFDLISPVHRDEFQMLMTEIFGGRVANYVHETVMRSPEGRERWLRIHYSPETSSTGSIESLVAIFEDITGEKESSRAAEQRRQQLIRADRMATLGTLVAGTAHEISNPNQVILGNIELASDMWASLEGEVLDSDGKMNRFFSRIGEGARRIAGIVENLKGYVRSAEAPGPELMDINESALRAASLLEQTIERSTTRFHIDLEPNMPQVSANPGRIEQVAVNFLMNACQALNDKDRSISLRTRHLGEYVSLEVLDEGPGIPEDLIGRITDPFVTSRRNEGGTGLGLSVCDGIARDYNGMLDFSNRPEGGAVARLHLPVAIL